MTDFDSTTLTARPPTGSPHAVTPRRHTRPAFPDLHDPMTDAQTGPNAPLAQGQVADWTMEIWAQSPLMRSLLGGIAIGLIAAYLTVWLFDNIVLGIAAYAVFGAVGILALALR